ncbi:ACT domain-containing protein [Caldicellulosiruptoraceae bacterium PP1]
MRAIITVVGKDRVGIIACVSNILAQNNVNILDISQTIMQGFFTMIMLVDLENSKLRFDEIKALLVNKGKEIGVDINMQHEDIFNAINRI